MNPKTVILFYQCRVVLCQQINSWNLWKFQYGLKIIFFEDNLEVRQFRSEWCISWCENSQQDTSKLYSTVY